MEQNRCTLGDRRNHKQEIDIKYIKTIICMVGSRER